MAKEPAIPKHNATGLFARDGKPRARNNLATPCCYCWAVIPMGQGVTEGDSDSGYLVWHPEGCPAP